MYSTPPPTDTHKNETPPMVQCTTTWGIWKKGHYQGNILRTFYSFFPLFIFQKMSFSAAFGEMSSSDTFSSLAQRSAYDDKDTDISQNERLVYISFCVLLS